MPSSETVAKKGFANVERPIETHIVDSPEAREAERRHTYLKVLPAISDILRIMDRGNIVVNGLNLFKSLNKLC